MAFEPEDSATPTEMACTTAVICAVVSALRTMAPVLAAVPVAVTGLSMMKALPSPVMLLSAVAPPPPMARLDCVPAATWIAVAREVASMVAASFELTWTSPLVAVTWLTFWRYACMSLSMSLREALRPTDTAVALRRTAADRQGGRLDLRRDGRGVLGLRDHVAVARVHQRRPVDGSLDVGADLVQGDDGADADGVGAALRGGRRD